MVKSLLRITDLHIYYDAVKALKGISLDVSRGEIVSVLGANGAGKSTLLRAISGLVPVHDGDILFQENSLKKREAYKIVIDGISHVPEGRHVFATLTVEENLNLGAFNRRSDKKIVLERKERVYDLFPILKNRKKQLAGTLSGGEQQMLAIGRGLMSDPELLLLDEPSLGLAPLLVKQIFKIIKEINEQGVAILLVEQNARKALAVANRAYVLETGRISISGLSSKLKDDKKIQEAYLGGSAIRGKNLSKPGFERIK
ncbi:MAG: ABC transporter ATP-binding protein [Candidatus Caldatribacteriota bacterium]|nr:ABC transporter ATP-binding protein [Atribacterota bacterium]MDD3640352.1 ABC transporter ATP-binding protein [Atribacterota bacterium]MDD4288039.1 ABC transporter ATP-binding protein [Atribacterota bacterium]MDI9596146.1 ABC transporter ATP-binding protein [Atribacterota bacterium]